MALWFSVAALGASVEPSAALASDGHPGVAATKAPAAHWVEISTDGGFVAADDRGFWTSAGQHFRFDGTRDVVLSPPPPSGADSRWIPWDDGLAFAALTEDEEIIRGTGSKALVVEWFGSDGKRVGRKVFAGGDESSRVETLGRLASGTSGSLIVGGQFSGCVEFGRIGRSCVDKKAAAKAHMCGGDACVEPFVMSLDRKGNPVHVTTLPGRPMGLFAASPTGEAAFGGVLDRVEPKASITGGIPKERRELPQTIVAVLDPNTRGSWRWSRSLLGRRSNGPDEIAFGADGTLWLTALVNDQLGDLDLVDGKQRQQIAIPPGSCTVVLGFSPRGTLRRQDVLCEHPAVQPLPSEAARKVRLLPTKSGMFAFGPFPTPTGVSLQRAASPHRKWADRVLTTLDGRGWALLVPYLFEVALVAPTPDGICVAFGIDGAHEVMSDGRSITLGRPHATVRAIACYPAESTGFR